MDGYRRLESTMLYHRHHAAPVHVPRAQVIEAVRVCIHEPEFQDYLRGLVREAGGDGRPEG